MVSAAARRAAKLEYSVLRKKLMRVIRYFFHEISYPFPDGTLDIHA